MKKAYRIGTLDEFFAASQEAVRSGKSMELKRWYGSEAIRKAAEAREAKAREAETMIKLVCDNIPVLDAIGGGVASVKDLAERTGRAPASISRTIKKLSQAGIVELSSGKGKAMVPRLLTDTVSMTVNFGPRGRIASMKIAGSRRKNARRERTTAPGSVA